MGCQPSIEAEDPVKLSIRSSLFILTAYFADEIVDIVLKIGGTPYEWILTSELPPLNFADFSSTVSVILGVCASGAVAIITLIMAWNYIKLLFEAAERYILLGVLIFSTCRVCYGSVKINIWYLPELVPNVGRPDIFAVDERMVSEVVYFDGRNVPVQSIIFVDGGDAHEKIKCFDRKKMRSCWTHCMTTM